jgi:hypothetical protein
LIHSVLQTKSNEIVDSFEMAGVKVMNLISERSTAAPARQAAKPQEPTVSAQVAPAV